MDGAAAYRPVRRRDNPRYCTLINPFGDPIGLLALLTTSFSVKGGPIVRTPYARHRRPSAASSRRAWTP
ncbi:MAG: hypothetical protein EXR47_04495 [Dehalococcoidia bacterium]|nr:hypothetical protein [Dehalococcoidia bacterium]